MKEIDELNLPADVRYSEDHEWALADGGLYRVGISDYAQDQLGDMVYVELPEIDQDVEHNGEMAVVESVKAASDVYAPIAGVVVAVNETLADVPETINSDAYGEGWIVRLQPADDADESDLMSPDDYQALLDELDD